MPLNEAVCGTPSGYHKHRRNGEEACDPCKEAVADYQRARRLRTGQVKRGWGKQLRKPAVYVPPPADIARCANQCGRLAWIHGLCGICNKENDG